MSRKPRGNCYLMAFSPMVALTEMNDLEQARERVHIAETWRRNLAAQVELCGLLEALADALPDKIDVQSGLNLARTIYPTIRRIHVFEEETVFPFLFVVSGSAADLAGSLERLRYEHMEDESLAEEIHDAITELVAGNRGSHASMLAYMLRGLFENLSRHVAFEREHLLPLVMIGGETRGGA
jgi:hypothetical protein